MTKVVYLNEFAWTFDHMRSDDGDASAADPSGTAGDDIDVIRRFPSFSAFLEQLIKDLSADVAAQQRFAELATLEEERALLKIYADQGR